MPPGHRAHPRSAGVVRREPNLNAADPQYTRLALNQAAAVFDHAGERLRDALHRFNLPASHAGRVAPQVLAEILRRQLIEIDVARGRLEKAIRGLDLQSDG